MAALSFRNKTLGLGIAIAVLAAAYVLGLVFSPANVRKREVETPLVPRFKSEAVTKIHLTSADGSVTLEKRDDQWLVPIDRSEYPASESRVEALLDFVKTIRRSRQVTANPDAWQDFGVDSSASQRVQLFGSGDAPILDLIVGKVDEAKGGSYVRLDDSNEVVLVNRLFDYYLNTEGRFWSYLRMLPAGLEGADINRITVRATAGFLNPTSGGLSYTLLRGGERGGEWQVLAAGAPGVALNDAKVDRLAATLADLEATSFAVGRSPAGEEMASQPAEILISTGDGKDFRLLVGDPTGEDRFYASLEGGKYLYEVARFRLETLFKPPAELAAGAKAEASGQ